MSVLLWNQSCLFIWSRAFRWACPYHLDALISPMQENFKKASSDIKRLLPQMHFHQTLQDYFQEKLFLLSNILIFISFLSHPCFQILDEPTSARKAPSLLLISRLGNTWKRSPFGEVGCCSLPHLLAEMLTSSVDDVAVAREPGMSWFPWAAKSPKAYTKTFFLFWTQSLAQLLLGLGGHASVCVH